MDSSAMFATALNLKDPWYIESVGFEKPHETTDNRGKAKREAASANKMVSDTADKKPVPHVLAGLNTNLELHIYINFYKGSTFAYPELVDGKEVQCKAYDTEEKVWRHLNFFQYKCYIHAPLPRVGSKDLGLSPKTIDVPWARSRSGFTLLFESFVVELSKNMTVNNVAETVGENDTKLWRIILHYVDAARAVADYSDVEKIGMDETSKKGRNYISVFVDIEKRKVLFVADGKDQTTVDSFVEDFLAHSGDCNKISVVTCDMALGFRAGIKANFPKATTVIDKFHVIKLANKAVDEVRRKEAKANSVLKHTKYIWLKNEENLTEKQLAKKQALSKKHLKTGRACMIREELQEIYDSSETREEAEASLKKLYGWMVRSRIDEIKTLAGTIKEYWKEILNYFDTHDTNAILEGLNNVIQNIKTRARGFKNKRYFSAMIYLVCGNLNIESLLQWG